MISVIVPVYNTSKYLEECIISILEQTYKDFELILIDDGSKDNSLQILKKYESIDQRVKVYRQANHGVSYTRNRGIDLATGDYIMFIDSDDWIESKTLQTLIEAMKKYNVDTVRGNYFVNREKEETVGNDFFEKNEIVYDKNQINDKIIPALISNQMKSFSCLYLIKSSILKKNIYYDEKIQMLEDQIMCLKLLTKINNIAFISDPLYHYRVNESSVTVKLDCIKQNIQSTIKANNIIANFLLENKFNQRYIFLLNKAHINLIIREFYRLHSNNLLDIEFLKYIRNLRETKDILSKYDSKLEENKKIVISVLLFRYRLYWLFIFLLDIKNAMRIKNT